jgi:hypothetical protein
MVPDILYTCLTFSLFLGSPYLHEFEMPLPMGWTKPLLFYALNPKLHLQRRCTAAININALNAMHRQNQETTTSTQRQN